MFDLISIGDTVIDTFIPLLDAKLEEEDGGNTRKLVLRYGDKIPVGRGESMVAGNAANNAVGSSRLKLKTAIYTNLGSFGDGDGDMIIKKFKSEEVNTRYIVKNSDLPSNHHIVLDFKGERTILIYHQPWKFSLPDLDKSKWAYLTSLSPSFVDSPLMGQLVLYLERSLAKLVFNPGTFQIKHGVKKYPRILSLTNLFIVNKEEAKIILGFSESDDIPIKKLLSKLADLGPKMVVITDGGEGSFGFDQNSYFKLGIFPAKLLEMTGSGDAYATGTLAGLFHGNCLSEAMRWGAANGASVVEYVGPQRGLLTYNQMQGSLKENKKIQVREI